MHLLLKVVVPVVVVAYFAMFTASNIQDANKYVNGTNKWAPKRAEGPLLFQVSKTNPSKFSRQKREMFLLYTLSERRVFTNVKPSDQNLALYYRLYCKLGRKGNVNFNGYDYSCPDLNFDALDDESYAERCDSSSADVALDNFYACPGVLTTNSDVYLTFVEGEYFISLVGDGLD